MAEIKVIDVSTQKTITLDEMAQEILASFFTVPNILISGTSCMNYPIAEPNRDPKQALSYQQQLEALKQLGLMTSGETYVGDIGNGNKKYLVDLQLAWVVFKAIHTDAEIGVIYAIRDQSYPLTETRILELQRNGTQIGAILGSRFEFSEKGIRYLSSQGNDGEREGNSVTPIDIQETKVNEYAWEAIKESLEHSSNIWEVVK